MLLLVVARSAASIRLLSVQCVVPISHVAADTVSIVLHIQVKIAAAYREASDCAVCLLAMTVLTIIWKSRAGLLQGLR